MLRISSYKFRSRWNNLTTTVQSDVGVQIYGNLSYDKPKKKKKSRHQTGEKAFNYEISRGRERGKRFKSSHFISSLLEKASLKVPSEWAVFPQKHLDNNSIGS